MIVIPEHILGTGAGAVHIGTERASTARSGHSLTRNINPWLTLCATAAQSERGVPREEPR
jgi:hypothetical protein